MTYMIEKVREKLWSPRKRNPDCRSSKSGSPKSRSPKGRSQSSSPNGRVIPPEPVQQNTNGDFSESEAKPPLQVHNLARASKNVKKLDWDTRLAHDAETYAKTLADTGIVEHSGVEIQGENIFVGESNAKLEDAVENWLKEEKKYHGERIGEGSVNDWQNFSEYMYRNNQAARSRLTCV